MQAFKFSFFKREILFQVSKKALKPETFLLRISFNEKWEACLESDLQKKEDIYGPLFDYYNEKVN